MTATYADSHDGLVERLDIEVRSLVRREGVDPQRDAGLVRRIAEGVVRDHDELSLTGAVAPVPDGPAMVGELVARVSGFGPLQQFLDDPAVEEIWINDPRSAFPHVRALDYPPGPRRVRMSQREDLRRESSGRLTRAVLSRRPQVRVRVQRDGRRPVS